MKCVVNWIPLRIRVRSRNTQTHLEESWNARKLGHAQKLGRFTREIALNNEFVIQFFPDLKVHWMTSERLLEIFIKLPMSDCSRAICVLLQGNNQLLVPSGWGKARNPSKISKDSFLWSHWIDQKRRQQISKSYIGNILLQILISCRICISKYANLRGNPWKTKLQLLLVLTVCYFWLLLISWVWLGQKIALWIEMPWRFVGRHFQLYDTSPMILNWSWAWSYWNCITSYKFSVSVKKMREGWTGWARDTAKAKSSVEDPRATRGLVSNLAHPRVNKTKQTLSFFVSWVSKTQPNHWTKRMANTRLAT